MPNYDVTIRNTSATVQDWDSPGGTVQLAGGAQGSSGLIDFNADVNFPINVTQVATGNFAGVTLRYRIATDTWSLWPVGAPFALAVAGTDVTLSCANIPAPGTEICAAHPFFSELLEQSR